MLRHFCISTAAFVFIFSATASARSAGAPAGVSGAPGDGLCTRCHGGQPNTGPGSVRIMFAGGSSYTPNEVKRVTVTIEHPNARRWGFEVSPRSGNGETGAGVLASVNDQTQVLPPADSKMWVTHTSAGTRSGTPGPVSFEFDWTAPSSAVGDINFYVAANAANASGNNQGDEIYTTTARLSPAASGPPAISQNGVVNAASFRPGISAGSWITIGGTNLASTTREWAAADIVNGVLPTSLDGTKVTINGKPAAVAFISPTQINALAPDDESTGNVNVVVTTPAGESVAVASTLQRFAPAFFQFGPADKRYAAAVHTDRAYVAPAGLFGAGATSRPARSGDVIQLFGTGFGPTNPAVPTNRAFSGSAALTNNVQITIGGIAATVQFAGISSNGLDQFNVVIPAGVPAGDQPVVATIGGVTTPSGVNLAVQ
jgi:uncharacterized protein (TIGR03437 family)